MSPTSCFVAQIFNLPYRRVALGKARHVLNAPELSHDSRITILRYSIARLTRNRIARSVWSAAYPAYPAALTYADGPATRVACGLGNQKRRNTPHSKRFATSQSVSGAGLSNGGVNSLVRLHKKSSRNEAISTDTDKLQICATIRRSRALLDAFTLVEMLVVLAVTALLVGTLVPAIARSGPNSLALQCLNNNRQLCAAWRMYADDNHDRIVYSSDDGTGSSNPLNQYAWTETHLDFSPQNRSNLDPALDIERRPFWPYTGKNVSIYRCPSDTSYVVVNGVPTSRVRSMSMNVYLGGFAGTDNGWSVAANYRIFLKTTDLTAPGPARTFVFLDERWDVINWGNFFTDMSGYPNQPASYGFNEDFPNMIHNRGCNFSFADGRAELHRWLDPRTTPPLGSIFINGSTASPRNQDIAWLQDHATRPK